MFVSVTRLRLRSWRFLPAFLFRAIGSARQADRAAGLVSSRTRRTARNAFWTLTLWRDEAAMRAYRNRGAHKAAMPRLLHWCDESAYTHWTTEDDTPPTWTEAEGRLRSGAATFTKMPHASPDHVARRIP